MGAAVFQPPHYPVADVRVDKFSECWQELLKLGYVGIERFDVIVIAEIKKIVEETYVYFSDNVRPNMLWRTLGFGII